ncbi:MAG: membrane integrity-associated transporter subunit PqiC [bacterium]|nr:membrane integrity-associated transporter subunit PqiC [bacterium]
MRTSIIRIRFLPLVLALLGTAACSGSPSTRYYVLKPTSSPLAGTSNTGLAVGVGPAVIPTRLDQDSIVTMGQGHEVTLADTHEWAEPLDESIVEVVGENLANTLGTTRIYRHPWDSDVELDYRVSLTVIRLGGGLGADAYLDVRWSVLDREGNERTRRMSSFRRPVPAQSYADLAGAISAMLGNLSQEIAAAIQGRTPVALPSAPPLDLAPPAPLVPTPPPAPVPAGPGLLPLERMSQPPAPEVRIRRGSGTTPQGR